MKISLIHPSRSRPEQSLMTINRWFGYALRKLSLEIIISLDDNDPLLVDYAIQYRGQPVIITTNKNRSAIEAINKGAKEATGDILIVVSDDTNCPSGWDEIITEVVDVKKDFLLKTFDGAQRWICTMPIMSRDYYESQGYIYHPDYLHMFCDTHLTHVADLQKKIIWRNDILFPHNHYSTGKTRKDAVNVKNDSTWKQGEATYLKHCRNKFGLGNVNIFDLSPEAHKAGHVQWLKHKLR